MSRATSTQPDISRAAPQTSIRDRAPSISPAPATAMPSYGSSRAAEISFGPSAWAATVRVLAKELPWTAPATSSLSEPSEVLRTSTLVPEPTRSQALTSTYSYLDLYSPARLPEP